MSLLPTVERGPSSAAAGVVIWLHGLGADGNDFAPIVPLLRTPSVRYVFPHAPARPVTINGGHVMRSWYDIRHLEPGPGRESDDDIRASAVQIEALIRHEIAAGTPAHKIVLAGFSQGGALAVHTGLRFDATLAGIMALSTYLVMPDALTAEAHASNVQTPALVCHGTEDGVVSFRRGAELADRLDDGRSLEWHDFPMGHEVCEPELAVIGAWIRARLGLG